MSLAEQVAALEDELSTTSHLLVEAHTMQAYWTKRAETAEAALREIVECHECSGTQCREIAGRIVASTSTSVPK